MLKLWNDTVDRIILDGNLRYAKFSIDLFLNQYPDFEYEYSSEYKDGMEKIKKIVDTI